MGYEMWEIAEDVYAAQDRAAAKMRRAGASIEEANACYHVPVVFLEVAPGAYRLRCEGGAATEAAFAAVREELHSDQIYHIRSWDAERYPDIERALIAALDDGPYR
jgi:hypothetical protein